ncbi:MAG: flagellar basal body-associated FliL family protein [Actinomycetota bacterium]
MADDTDDEEEEEEGGGKNKIVMIVGGLAVLGAVYNFVLKPSPPPDEMAAVVEEEPEEVMVEEGEIVELEEMILNIPDMEGNRGFLRIGLAIVLAELEVAKDFEAESAIAKDVAVQYLSGLTQEDLMGPEKQTMVKDQLTELVREAYGQDRVSRVLITALVMQ